MYAAMPSLVSKYFAGSNGLVFPTLMASPLPVSLLLRCPYPASPCRRHNNNEKLSPLDEIHAIARAVVDPEFAHTLTHRLYVAGIAEGETADTGRNLRFCQIVSEFVQPGRKCLRLPNLNHKLSVA
jgi:hypothetical protein